jgi:hypothetical protein
MYSPSCVHSDSENVTRILFIHPISKNNTDCDGHAIIGEGNRTSKPIADCIPWDILTDLLPIPSFSAIIASLQRKDSCVSWAFVTCLVGATCDGTAIGRNIYEHSNPITIIVAIDGLAQTLPACKRDNAFIASPLSLSRNKGRSFRGRSCSDASSACPIPRDNPCSYPPTRPRCP